MRSVDFKNMKKKVFIWVKIVFNLTFLNILFFINGLEIQGIYELLIMIRVIFNLIN